MSNECACPEMDECDMYNNTNPIFLGEKSPFRGINILDPNYRLGCEGLTGIPCFEGCGHYKLIRREYDDFGLSESFSGLQGVDANDIEEGEEIVGLENMTQVITIEDGCGSGAPAKTDKQKQYGGKIRNGVFRCF